MQNRPAVQHPGAGTPGPTTSHAVTISLLNSQRVSADQGVVLDSVFCKQKDTYLCFSISHGGGRDASLNRTMEELGINTLQELIPPS